MIHRARGVSLIMIVKYAFNEDHPDTIVLMCSDGRFTRIVWELLNSLKQGRYDTVSMPGGPALLDMSSGNLIEVEASRAGTSFLIKGHNIKYAHLIAHRNCGFYAHRYAGQTPERIEDRQIRDLKAAAAWLKKAHNGLEVCAWMVFPDPEKSEFLSIDLSKASDYLLA